MPDISIIMRAKDEENGLLFDTLNTVANQTRRDFEVILVYSDFRADTLRFIESRSNIKLDKMPPSEYTSAGALNRGVRQAEGRILVSLNADATPLHGWWLDNLVKPLENPSIAGVFGRQWPRPDATPWVKLTYHRTFGTTASVRRRIPYFFSNVNSAWRRELWERHPFSVDVSIAEDFEWAKWAQSHGYSIVYEPEAEVYHSHNVTFNQLFKRHVQEGRGLYLITARPYSVGRLIASYLVYTAWDVAYFLARGQVQGAVEALWSQFAMRWGLYTGYKQARRERSVG
jgi:rhamnosyltransferase